MSKPLAGLTVLAAALCLVQAAQADKLEFNLVDTHGRRVTSQDYKGVPIFLEFGACW